jgi:hypothetical protein
MFMTKRIALTGVAAMAVAASLVGGAVAAFPQDNVKLYTGCLTSGGSLINVAEGDNPLQACSSPKQAVKLSGGDITAVRTLAGSGLTGGSDNGAVSLALDAKYSLPQSCANTQIAKWNGTSWACAADNDTTYSAGTGLALSGTQFSVASDYRVKNSTDCDSGKFATGFDSGGTIQCSTPATSSVPTFDADVSDIGLTDNVRTPVGSIYKLAAGKYFVAAKGVITSENNVDDNSSVTCFVRTLDADANEIGGLDDVIGLSSDTLNAVDDVPFALDALANVPADGTIQLACDVDNGADGVGMRAAHIVALKLG